MYVWCRYAYICVYVLHVWDWKRLFDARKWILSLRAADSVNTCEDERQGCWRRNQQGGWRRIIKVSSVQQHKSQVLGWNQYFCLDLKKEKRQQMKISAHNLLSVMLRVQRLKKKTHNVASRFIGFGELPGSSAEGFLHRQFNRCHSFCHIKDRRGRQRAAKLRHASAGFFFEVQGCRLSRLFPTLSRTSGIRSCCFYWPWTFNLLSWPFTSELWTTDPGQPAVCLKEWNFPFSVYLISQVRSLHNTAGPLAQDGKIPPLSFLVFTCKPSILCFSHPVWGFQGRRFSLLWVL